MELENSLKKRLTLYVDDFESSCLEQLLSKACEISRETDPGFRVFVNILDQIKHSGSVDKHVRK